MTQPVIEEIWSLWSGWYYPVSLRQIILLAGDFDYHDCILEVTGQVTGMLTEKQTHTFRKKLEDRHRQLRDKVRQELLASGDQRFIDLAGEVYDLEEASVADLLVDLDLAILDMHIEEIRDIDAALKRMAQGVYGRCIDCGDDIVIKRLRAYPTAKRCMSCQSRYEISHAGPATPSL